VYRRHLLDTGSGTERENLVFDVKGNDKWQTPRGRIPTRRSGAELSVVRAEQRAVQEGSSPSGARMRSVISESGVKSLAGRRSLKIAGWQGARREVGSEGHEEKYRAVIEGAIPKMNRSAEGGTRSSPHYRGEGVLIHPPNRGVCGQHGTEEQRVTSGGLTRFAVGTAISGPISASEMENDAVSVVGLPE
jgi:hypothetical protein